MLRTSLPSKNDWRWIIETPTNILLELACSEDLLQTSEPVPVMLEASFADDHVASRFGRDATATTPLQSADAMLLSVLVL